MGLLDVFRKSKKAAPAASLGRMWACAVKFNPCDRKWYDAVIKETDIVSAGVRDGITCVESPEPNPFHFNIVFRGPVGRLEYVSQLSQWVGFFETEGKAKEAYRLFAADLVRRIESASRPLLRGENREEPVA